MTHPLPAISASPRWITMPELRALLGMPVHHEQGNGLLTAVRKLEREGLIVTRGGWVGRFEIASVKVAEQTPSGPQARNGVGRL